VTTEQMDWLDDERAGRHKPPAPVPDGVVDTEDTMRKVSVALSRLGLGAKTVESAINSMQNAGILFRERVTDQEEHTHYTDRATRLCAEGDHDSAELWDRDAERVKIRENEKHIREVYDLGASEMTTMAEEPIADRLRRAWLNGYTDGYSEGFNRAAYQTNWERS
jgi:hypothetical protein